MKRTELRSTSPSIAYIPVFVKPTHAQRIEEEINPVVGWLPTPEIGLGRAPSSGPRCLARDAALGQAQQVREAQRARRGEWEGPDIAGTVRESRERRTTQIRQALGRGCRQSGPCSRACAVREVPPGRSGARFFPHVTPHHPRRRPRRTRTPFDFGFRIAEWNDPHSKTRVTFSREVTTNSQSQRCHDQVHPENHPLR